MRERGLPRVEGMTGDMGIRVAVEIIPGDRTAHSGKLDAQLMGPPRDRMGKHHGISAVRAILASGAVGSVSSRSMMLSALRCIYVSRMAHSGSGFPHSTARYVLWISPPVIALYIL